MLIYSLINPLNPELNPICYLLALLGAHNFLHVSRIRVKFVDLEEGCLFEYGALKRAYYKDLFYKYVLRAKNFFFSVYLKGGSVLLSCERSK